MLDDRSYMRAPQRQYWFMTTLLLISLVACYVVQVVLNQLAPGWANDHLTLSLTGLKAGKLYQLLTFQFMHGSIWHLACNMIGLYFFGRLVEEMIGAGNMLKLYLLSGTVGGLCHVALCLAFPDYFYRGVVGASAGVFGLIAAFATREPNYPITLLVFFVLPVTLLAKWLLLFEAVVSIGGLFLPGTTAHGAHLGGMLTGMAWIKWGGLLEGAGGWWAAGNPPARLAPAGADGCVALLRPAARQERRGIAAGGVYQPGGGSHSRKDFRPRHSQSHGPGTRDFGGGAEQNGEKVKIL